MIEELIKYELAVLNVNLKEESREGKNLRLFAAPQKRCRLKK